MSNLVVRILAQNLTKAGFAQAGTTVQKFEASVQRATQRLGRMAIVAAAMGGVGLAKFASFDKSVREIGTLLDNVTERDIKRMGAEIERMSIRFGQSVEKMAKAKYDIISAGFTGAADSAKLLEVSAKLAAAGVTEVSRTADVLTSVLNAYGQSADQAEHFSDILFTTVRLGKTTVDELASGLGRVAAVAPQVGVGFGELSAAVATLTAGGQSTEEVVTALTATMMTMLKPSLELSDRFNALGFSSGQAMIKSLGLAETLRKLTEGMTDTEKAAMFPNVRALRAVFPLVGSLADKFSKNLIEMGNVAGATNTAFEQMEKGISFKLGQLRQIGEKVLRRFGALVADLVTSFLNLTPATQNLAIAVMALGVAFKFLGGPITLIAGLAYIIYQAWDKNIFGIRQLIVELAEHITHVFNETVSWVKTSAAIIKATLSGTWMDIGVFLALRNAESEEEYKRHTDRMLEINSEFAGAYVGTWKDLVPDFASMLGLGDVGKTGEAATEATNAVIENTIKPLEVARMESAARVAEDEVKTLSNAGIVLANIQRDLSMRIEQMWKQGWENIGNSMIAQVGDAAASSIVGGMKDAWEQILKSFASMIISMTARWLAFKALTSIGLGGLFFSRGGIVGQEHMPKVQRAQTGMVAQGFDTVPAMLRQGEAVIPTERTRENLPAIRQIMSGQSSSAKGGGDVTISPSFNIQAWDGNDVRRVVRSTDFRNTIVDMIEEGLLKLNVNGLRVQGVR